MNFVTFRTPTSYKKICKQVIQISCLKIYFAGRGKIDLSNEESP